jgi:hypothetical protein
MEYQDVVGQLAPCGLDCGRCADYDAGEIRQLASRLQQLLGNYQRLAGMRAAGQPEFVHYPQFAAVLGALATAGCGGCRSQAVRCPLNCTARTCHTEQGVDFCFQCSQYPCDKQFEGRLRERWLNIQNRMREIGAVAYYQEQLQSPRY